MTGFIPRERLDKKERQRALFTPKSKALIARVYATVKTDTLTAVADRFRKAQQAARKASTDFDYRWNRPRRRADLEKLATVEF